MAAVLLKTEHWRSFVRWWSNKNTFSGRTVFLDST